MNYKSKGVKITRVTNSVAVTVCSTQETRNSYVEVAEQCLFSQC